MKKTILVFVGLLGLGSLVWIPQVRSQAADSTAAFTISDIRVEGLQRISAGTVFNYLPAGVGSTISPADYAEIIRALFKTGFFTDISLARDGNVLVINVVERPSVAEINISGNKDISTDELLTALRDIGLAEGRVFDRALLDRIEQELINQYFGRGKYAAKLDVAVRTLPRNRVAIDLTVSEGVAARIRQINIVGNQDFDDDDLLDQFQLTTSGIITILTKSDQYSKQKLEADIEALRSFYLDRGYLRFNVNSTQVSISPDKKDIFITINITEGEPYTIRDVNLRGNLLVPEEELRGLITLQEGEVFSRSEANQVVQALADRFGEDGYAFAVINTIPNLDDATSQVDLTFAIDPGRRVYVRRINFTGNLKTNDDVLRREMRQAEGGWFSTKDIKRSQIRLQRLPYLADVQVDSQPVPGSPDQVDIDVAVEERNSGSLNVGLGYGQTEGFLFNAAVSQSNFLGTGNEVGFAFNNSDSDTLYSLTYNNPYYTP
ncbi:MAG: outer membrane protein assembly factor BamA, partial [Candidatus Competibacteraceae bacterium]|nr:outer membrane protein assembly factor BamA [Candidatus Competibacteraceae bacterium]